MLTALRCRNVPFIRQIGSVLLCAPHHHHQQQNASFSITFSRSPIAHFRRPNYAAAINRRWACYKAAILEELGQPMHVTNVENSTPIGGEMVIRNDDVLMQIFLTDDYKSFLGSCCR